MAYSVPDNDTLHQLYVEQLLSAKAIGERYGVAVGTVLRWLGENGIKARKPGGGRPTAAVQAKRSAAAIEAMRAAGLEPLEPYPGIEVPWRCRCLTCGHERTPTLKVIRRGTGGCKPCGDARAGLARRTPHDEAAALMRAAGMEPLERYPGRHKKWKSRCEACDEIRYPRLADIQQGKGGCKPCGDRKRGLARRHPHALAVEIMNNAGLEPLETYPGSHVGWRCRCLGCGNETSPKLSNIVAGQGGCRRCGYVASGLAQRTDEAEAIASMEAVRMEPLVPYPGGHTGWLARCRNCGTVSAPRLTNVRSGRGGCHPCGYARMSVAMSIPEDEVIASMLSTGLEPQEPYPGRDRPWRCRCMKCGTIGSPRAANIRNGGGGCVPCGRILSDAARRLPETQTVAELRAKGMEPLEPYPGADRPWRSVCTTCGEIGQPRLSNLRKENRGGCNPCGSKQRGLASRLSAEEAIASMRAANLEPLDEYPGTQERWRCRCLGCDAVVHPRLANIRYGFGGCRTCAPFSFDWDAPTVVYVITHDVLAAHKVGIAGENSPRLQGFRRHGWRIHATLPLATGHSAYQAEQAVFRLLGYMGVTLSFLSRDQMPLGGHTETICASDISLEELTELARSEMERLPKEPQQVPIRVGFEQITLF